MGTNEKISAEQRERLIQAATKAYANAYAPYSEFHVGAAVLTAKGEVFTGCNVENASYGMTNCAERTAIFSAIAKSGPELEIRAVAVISAKGGPCSPCGACRQVIYEFGPEAILFYPGGAGWKQSHITELLPEGFRLKSSSAASPASPFRAVDIIRKKRDGLALTAAEISQFIAAYTRGEVPDYQASAWLMAAIVRGLSPAETAALTDAMLHSGEVLDLSELPAKKVDKHSTGGVGDKTSLVLAPLVAAGGLFVPMISGRGLGHTGGTLDKLESIPGFNVNLSVPRFREVLRTCGCAMIGQTSEIAPADRKLYALRDVTATVESQNLICASIMSKKLAEGIDALVLDVKTGSGAFMKRQEDAESLANLMVDTGTRMGKKVVALITDMDQPLGSAAGNALEVLEVLEVLRGAGPEDLRELCLTLGAWMFHLGGVSQDIAAGRELGTKLIASGKAIEKFGEMIKLQGGNHRILEDASLLPRAERKLEVVSTKSGFVTGMNCEALGTATVILGGGRTKKEDKVDHAVGLVVHKKIGDPVSIGESLCTIHYNAESPAHRAQQLIVESYQIGNIAPAKQVLIRKVITK